ncbi:hypothetical protein [Streptomyces canus]|uniref:hypothetical protein n=1 Tax=Streptomyces canus TaxID=58343 RepID=UPI0032465BBA
MANQLHGDLDTGVHSMNTAVPAAQDARQDLEWPIIGIDEPEESINACHRSDTHLG